MVGEQMEAGPTNTDGTITSTVQANTAKMGFQ